MALNNFPVISIVLLLILGSYHASALLRNTNSLEIQATTSSQGFVYFNFYSSNNCGGSTTLQNGVATNVCLPASYYGVPGTDDFVLRFDYFMISGLSADCSTLLFTYSNYSDCSLGLNSTLPDFTSCRVTSNLGIPQLKSSRGYCSVGTSLPIARSSYVLSEYSTNQYTTTNEVAHCNSSQPIAFTAYPLNLCLGTTNFTSNSFASGSNGESILMYQYYDSNVCQNLTSYGEQTLTIPVGCQFLTNSSISTTSTRNSIVKVGSGSSSDSSLSDAEIAGIVVGGVAFVALAGAVVATTVFGVSLFSSSAAAQAGDGTVTPKGSMDRGSELSSPVISYQNSYGSKSPLTPTTNPLQTTEK